jgi:methionyl-tRNA formyltransferase
MGTPDFAVPALKALHEAGHDLPLLISQPDRKKGRGQKLQETPTKRYAKTIGCEIFQPDTLHDQKVVAKLADYKADFFVVVAYGKILPSLILNLPAKACLNLHASLLPKWRGAAPIQFAIWQGDRETGICTMLMDKGMDTGDLLLTTKTVIQPDEKADQLSNRLSQLGGQLIVRTITEFEQIIPQPQDHTQATYTRMIEKEDRLLNWEQSAEKVYAQFRALSPQPGVFTYFRGKRLLVKEISLAENRTGQNQKRAGSLLSIAPTGLEIACSSGVISLHSCQPENKKQSPAKDFANGYQVKIGDIFGQ